MEDRHFIDESDATFFTFESLIEHIKFVHNYVGFMEQHLDKNHYKDYSNCKIIQYHISKEELDITKQLIFEKIIFNNI